ncbi:MAG: 6,7-dimethyl-8-ribityllumazine synthase [Burkholderiaceae bacterium]|nr:6,7-dimethyl-8-ribityllumazine synthase [Burkholderiaceae bacterium]MDO9089099.1 6,7-dimethyl-8-ribityllumazine synthase [Burkholderiaceae bacterium]
MNQTDYTLSTRPAAVEENYKPQSLPAGTRVAFIEAGWHADIVQQARQAFIEEMARHQVGAAAIDVVQVPGAFEIPLHARKLAQSGRYAAIVGCALVVDGGIYRHEFVAQTVVGALMQVQMETDVPVLSAVLTPHHFHEHAEHRKYFSRHFRVKGTEAARACAQTVAGLKALDERLGTAAVTGARRPAAASAVCLQD